MTEVRVPELARLSQPIEPPAALAEPVEVLLAREREPRPHAPAGLHGHPALVGLAQQPLTGGVRKRQAQRSREHRTQQVHRKIPSAQQPVLGGDQEVPHPEPKEEPVRHQPVRLFAQLQFGRLHALSYFGTKVLSCMIGIRMEKTMNATPPPIATIITGSSSEVSAPTRISTCAS